MMGAGPAAGLAPASVTDDFDVLDVDIAGDSRHTALVTAEGDTDLSLVVVVNIPVDAGELSDEVLDDKDAEHDEVSFALTD